MRSNAISWWTFDRGAEAAPDLLLGRFDELGCVAALSHDDVAVVLKDHVLHAHILMSMKNEERVAGLVELCELVDSKANRPGARRIRALAHEVHVRELCAKALGHAHDLLVHGAKEELITCSAFLPHPLRRLHDSLSVRRNKVRPGEMSWSELTLGPVQRSRDPG
jgi:hypothetical protein